MPKPQPWSPADATDEIRALAREPSLRITYSQHAKERLEDRDLTIGDVLYVLRNGFVYEDAADSTKPGLFKYAPESGSPNSGNRTVRVIVIPDPTRTWVKIITVMWADER